MWGGWLVASAACLLPTFFIGSLAFSIGGKLSLFFPVTAIGYLFTQLVAQIAFRERTDAVSWLGVCLIVAGVVISAWPR